MDQKLGMGRPGLQADASGCKRMHTIAWNRSPQTRAEQTTGAADGALEPLKFPFRAFFSFASHLHDRPTLTFPLATLGWERTWLAGGTGLGWAGNLELCLHRGVTGL